jgi:hypothetical protein
LRRIVIAAVVLAALPERNGFEGKERSLGDVLCASGTTGLLVPARTRR